MNATARLFILSGPSGVGKTTICKAVAQSLNLYYSISTTTRSMRAGEVDGVHYYFVSESAFKQAIANKEFLEYALVYDRYYGTSKKNIDEHLALGQSVILDLDTQGALRLKAQLGELAVLIFVEPPDLDTLKQRIQARKTETPERIASRLASADYEMSFKDRYDYIVINDDLDDATNSVLQIVETILKKH